MFNRNPLLTILVLTLGLVPVLKSENRAITHGQQYDRLIIRNVILIDGKGTPARGPVDVVIEKNIIQSVTSAKKSSDAYQEESHVLDGTGMYLLPGLINLHAHIHDSRAGHPLPFEYLYKLWLGCGITTVRDVGSNYDKTLKERQKSKTSEIIAPRIFLYMRAWGRTPENVRIRIRDIKKLGGDGVKIFGMDRYIMKAALDEAHRQNLRVAHHTGVEETDAWDDAAFRTTTIEHWYGIPDAALKGSQNFPSSYNYSNESDRFRYAGRLWREADPEKLLKVLHKLIDNEVGWCPTFVIYEADRDLQRAMNQPWFNDYLHPAVEEYFQPNPEYHGSFQWDWSTTDEVFWKENYRIWMKAVRDFADMGGTVGVGEDAGYIWMLYGFSLIRELELHQEAGFHPIDVIMNATTNNARLLGIDNKLGRVGHGYLADLILLNENPLENLKYLYPTGVPDLKDGQVIRKGGIQWTIKHGITYSVPILLKEVRELVSKARMTRL